MSIFTKRKLISKLIPLFGMTIMAASQTADAQYCAATNTSSTTYYITSVTSTGGITNLSNTGTSFSTGGYADYTAQSILTPAGASLSLTCVAGPSGYTYVWGIWCDWNQDFDFNDPGETVFTQSTYINTINPTFTVPATSNTGNIRMRIRNAYISPVPPACGANTYGEAEDYIIKVLPPNNVAMGSLINPNNVPFCSNSTQPIAVSIKNNGSNAINSATINWSVNGVLQTPYMFTNSLVNYNDSAVVTIGNVFFSDLTAKSLKVWTSVPNGMPDPIPADDSLSKSIGATMEGVEVHIAPRDTIICTGTSITLDAGTHPKNPIYIWSNATLTQTLNVSTAGVYSVKVQNTDGCFDYDTVTVTEHPNPLVNSIALIDNADGSYTFNVIGAQNITSYEWDFGDGQTQPGTGIPGQTIHQYLNAGEYNVKLTLSNDCGDIETNTPISTKGIPTGIDNLSALQKEISIFPNPSRSEVTISNAANIKMKSVNVFNIMGQKVFENGKVNSEKYKMNISNLAVGIYNVVIDTDAGRVVKKLEVLR